MSKDSAKRMGSAQELAKIIEKYQSAGLVRSRTVRAVVTLGSWVLLFQGGYLLIEFGNESAQAGVAAASKSTNPGSKHFIIPPNS